MSRGVARRAVALGATAAVLLGGCLSDVPTPAATPPATPAPEPTASVTTYRLSTTVWYAGFVLAFETATATLDDRGGPVAVALTIENRGPADASLDGPILLTAGGRGIEPRRDSLLPLVPAGGTVAAVITFEVDGAFDTPRSVIRVGRPEEHQAIVPLTGRDVATVTLEPLTMAVDVKGQAGVLLVELEGLELRADLPDWNQELGRGVFALTLTYGATYRSNFAGGFPFTSANVALRLPDGTLVQPRRDGRSQSVALIGPGSREAGLRSRFEVPAPGDGSYAFVVTDGTTSRDLPFTVERP